MKKILILFCLFLAAQSANSQCISGVSIGTLTPTGVFQTIPVVPGPAAFRTFPATAGITYIFSYCQGGGSYTGDTYLTITDNAGPTSQTFNDDFCALGSEITWTCATTGTYRIYMAGYPCTNSPSAVLAYRMNPPANDLCSAATAVAMPSTTAGQTISATAEVPAPPTCITTYTGAAVWYTVVGNGNRFTASTCGSAFDTKISVYTGSCGTWTCVTGNDDFCALQSTVNWCSVNATTYFILVHGFSGNTGTFSLILSQTVVPTMTVTPAAVAICSGQSTTITASGVSSYVWAPGGMTTAAVTVTPAATTTYTVTGTDAGTGCTKTGTSAVTVNPTPTVTVTPSTTYCNPGPGVTLTAANASTYSWGPATGLSATTGTSVVATPAVTTTYTVTGTSALGCLSAGVTTTITVAPAVSVVSTTATPATICSGNNSALLAVGNIANVYCQPTYSNGTGSGDYCSLVQLGTINNATLGAASPYYTLFPAVGSTTTTLVAGTTYTITLSAGTYTQNDLAAWIDYSQNSVLNDAGEKLGETDNLGVSPATTSFTFTVPLTAKNGRTRLRVREMDHGTTNDMDPCNPQSTYGETEDYSITITGGVDLLTYTWSPATFLSSTTGSTVTAIAATATTAYTVTAVSAAGCSATGNTTLTVNPNPVVTANTTANAVCSGGSVTLTGGGASTYVWSGSVTDGVAFVPASTTTYTVTGTSALGCTNTATVTITVIPLPTVTANSTASAVCAGGSVTLTGSGATTYTWDNSVTDAVSFVPAATTTYMVTGTDGNGCMDMDMITVTVNALPTVTANSTAAVVCSGGSVTLTGSGATTYTWDNSVTDAVSFVPAATTTYMVTGTDGNGCMNTDMTTVTVNALPTVTANSTSAAVCAGGSVTLTGGGATTYTWDNSVIDAVSFVPTATTTYMVTGTDANGCMNTASTTVTVNPLPTVTGTAASSTVCVDDAAVVLTGTPTSGTWSGPGVTGSSFSPIGAGVGSQTATYTFTDVNGCTNTATATITVNACVGVIETSLENGFNVYPNPNSGVFTLAINANIGTMTIELVDIQGRVVFSSLENNVNAGFTKQISMETVANGVYMLRLTSATEQQIIKVSVQK